MTLHERKTDHLPLTHEETKAAVKEAHKEWLDEKWNEASGYLAKAFLAALLLVVVKLMLAVNGYKLIGR